MAGSIRPKYISHTLFIKKIIKVSLHILGPFNEHLKSKVFQHKKEVLLIYFLSNKNYQIHFIKYHLSKTLYQKPFIKYPLSNTIYQIPFIKYHLSNILYQIPFIKYHVSNTICSQNFFLMNQ